MLKGDRMTSNLVQFPRPLHKPPTPAPLAFFVHVGRNDHRELLELIATGERGVRGFVIEAQNITRHRELIAEASDRGFDLILDPKLQGVYLAATQRIWPLSLGA